MTQYDKKYFDCSFIFLIKQFNDTEMFQLGDVWCILDILNADLNVPQTCWSSHLNHDAKQHYYASHFQSFCVVS